MLATENYARLSRPVGCRLAGKPYFTISIHPHKREGGTVIKWMTTIWVAVQWNNRLIAEIRYAHIIMVAAALLAIIVVNVTRKKAK